MNNNKKKGFTLAELLIVVSIIAVLVAIAIPTFNRKLEDSREAVDLQNARIIQTALASMVNDGTVEIPKKDHYGIWVIVKRKNGPVPGGYNGILDATCNVYGGADEGVVINGKTVSKWNSLPKGSENDICLRLKEFGIDTNHLSTQSKGKDGQYGWDWYVIQYLWDEQKNGLVTLMFSGFGNKNASYNIWKNNQNNFMSQKYGALKINKK